MVDYWLTSKFILLLFWGTWPSNYNLHFPSSLEAGCGHMTNFLLMRHEQKSYVEFLAIFCKVIDGALRSCFFVSLPFTVPDCYKGAGSSRLREKAHASTPAWVLPMVFILENLLALWVLLRGFPGKESACNAGDLDSIPGSGRSPGEGNGNPLQYSCLENSMDRGAIVHGVAKSQTQLCNYHFHFKGYLADRSLRVCSF